MANGSPGAPVGGLTDILTTLKNGVVAINAMVTALGRIFPQSGATATTATAGTHGAPPAQVAGYLEVTVNGAVQKIPYYNS